MIITYLFFASASIHLLFWLFLFTRLITVSKASSANFESTVSVIVVFKNELNNLKQLVPKLLQQDYQNFEIILCDDFSDDGSFEYVNSLNDPRINALKASKNKPGKKAALAEAISHTTGDYVLVTDADCLPKTRAWISSMTQHLQGKKVVLGYSPHLATRGLLNKFIRFETYMTALQYLSYAVAGLPYMGVGRNMLYQKELFMTSDAFARNPKLISGDDDLFINAVANKNNTQINIDPDSFVSTHAVETWSAFFKQKRRHISASVAYKLIHKILLTIYSLSHMAIYALMLGSIFLGAFSYVLIGYLIITSIKWIIATKSMQKLSCENLIIYFPLLDFMVACYYLIMIPSSIFKPKSW